MNEDVRKFIIFLKNENNYSDNTIENYKRDLEQFFLYLNEKKLNYKHLTKDLVREYLKYLNLSKYSSRSISRHLSTLKSYYKYLINNKIILNNPFSSIKNPKIEKKLPNYLDFEDLKEILDVFDITKPLELRNKLIIELFYSTGIRLHELISVKINDISSNDTRIKVLGKGNKERIVYYGDYVKELLDMYLPIRDVLLKGKSNDYLFINNKGDNLTESGIHKIFNLMLKKVNVKNKITPHTLRHTFATHMLNNGADIKTVQELLGHTSLSTTSIYTHISNERLRSVYLKTHPRNRKD